MSNLKNQLYEELKIKNEVSVEGISINPKVFDNADLGGKYQEQIHNLFEYDKHPHVGKKFPTGFTSPGGLKIPFRWDNSSNYKIEFENNKFYLTKKGHQVFDFEFLKRPEYYKLKTSDGMNMSHVATYNTEGTIFVAYSNECSLKDKGQECKFCNINATKDNYGDAEGILWKYPKQIGEVTAAAYKDGARHITITGGFVPERREVDYYIDVAEAVREYTGLQDFNGTGVIGAPLDLEVINKYKEAGYRTIAMNIEIWDKNIYNSICPGKRDVCGGWDHWVKALEYSAKVFGHGRVRSNIVGGLEPKNSTLEGVEYLASQGIICSVGAWCPNPGSELEGHRSPEPDWHLDMAYKVNSIYRKAGFAYEQLYDSAAAPTSLCHDLYKIEDELLPIFKK